jgi:L-iditol 2-dehydrogenase
MLAGKLKNGEVYLAEEDEPKLSSPKDVLVKVKYVSICGYEMMIYHGTASANPLNRVGHEVSGVVAATGSEVTTVKPGDEVCVALYTPCGTCPECVNKRFDYCENMHTEHNGMREMICVPESAVYTLNGLSLKAGCLIEPLTMAMSAIKNITFAGGETVLILGGGAMGIMLLKLLDLYPVSKIVVSEPQANKRLLAKQAGAFSVLNPDSEEYTQGLFNATIGKGFDIVIEASGSQTSAKTAMQYVSRGGHLIFYGLYGMNYELPLNLFSLYWNDITVNAVLPSSYLYAKAIKLAQKMNLEELITAEYSIHDIKDAFEAKSGGKHLKVVIRMD